MSLRAKLDALREDFDAGRRPYNAPAWIVETIHRATRELIESGLADRALKPGDIAPTFNLQDSCGATYRSADMLATGPIVVTFYRGTWCPFCNLDLQALEDARPQIETMGASLLAISPQTAANSRRSIRQNKLGFPILSDPGNEVAAEFGIRFTLPDYLVALYRDTLNNDLAIVNGDASWTLPMPARFVIRQDGQITYSEVNPDYTRRPEPAEVVAVLQRVGEGVS